MEFTAAFGGQRWGRSTPPESVIECDIFYGTEGVCKSRIKQHIALPVITPKLDV